MIAPPPDLRALSERPGGTLALGQSAVVAPSPQLAIEEQHVARRGSGHIPGGSVQPVAPAPSVSASGNANSGGRLVAFRNSSSCSNGACGGSFRESAGSVRAIAVRPGASGTPHTTGTNQSATNFGNKGTLSSLPSGLHVGAADSSGSDGRELARTPSLVRLRCPFGFRNIRRQDH